MRSFSELSMAVAIFEIAYALIITERVHKTIVALSGATLMIVSGVVTQDEAFYSHEFGVDYNVIFLLIGMMVIVNIVRETGLFEVLAIWSAQRAGAQPFRLLALLAVITAVLSAMLDNVTTVLLMAPVTLSITKRLELRPVPFLIAEAMASNIGGTATLVGDPPNIMIASKADLGYLQFLVMLGPIAATILSRRAPRFSIAATADSRMPSNAPRQPACAAATMRASGSASSTGRQSATPTASAMPGLPVTSASAFGRASAFQGASTCSAASSTRSSCAT